MAITRWKIYIQPHVSGQEIAEPGIRDANKDATGINEDGVEFVILVNDKFFMAANFLSVLLWPPYALRQKM